MLLPSKNHNTCLCQELLKQLMKAQLKIIRSLKLEQGENLPFLSSQYTVLSLQKQKQKLRQNH